MVIPYGSGVAARRPTLHRHESQSVRSGYRTPVCEVAGSFGLEPAYVWTTGSDARAPTRLCVVRTWRHPMTELLPCPTGLGMNPDDGLALTNGAAASCRQAALSHVTLAWVVVVRPLSARPRAAARHRPISTILGGRTGKRFPFGVEFRTRRPRLLGAARTGVAPGQQHISVNVEGSDVAEMGEGTFVRRDCAAGAGWFEREQGGQIRSCSPGRTHRAAVRSLTGLRADPPAGSLPTATIMHRDRIVDEFRRSWRP